MADSKNEVDEVQNEEDKWNATKKFCCFSRSSVWVDKEPAR